MKITKIIKSNRAATMADIVIGLIILIIFTGVITSGYTMIYKSNVLARMDAYAVSYAVKIMEDIDRMPYDEVTEELNTDIKTKYDMFDAYDATLEITDKDGNRVLDFDENAEINITEDLVKNVKLTIQYEALDNEVKTYKVEKIKVREIKN